ncbi:MAG: cytochrome c oxidase assembly protein [Chloroflexota bacterium]
MLNVLTDWSFEPLVLVPMGLALLLYWRGTTGTNLSLVGRRPPVKPWQALCFYGGLLVVFVALESPIDAYDNRLFWAHMIQHVLLIMVAAPLISLGDPAVPMLRGIPLGIRRRSLKVIMRQRWIHKLGKIFSWLGSPRQVFVIFLVDLYAWHWNKLFNLTLQNQAVHDLEHVCFLVTGLLFWGQIIDQRPMHARLSYAQRAIYTVVTAFGSNLLAMYFVFTLRPVYAAYAAVAHRPGGLTAVADQQYAGAIMWVPALLLFGGACVVCVYKWLGEDEDSNPAVAVPAAPYSVLLTPGQSRSGKLS